MCCKYFHSFFCFSLPPFTVEYSAYYSHYYVYHDLFIMFLLRTIFHWEWWHSWHSLLSEPHQITHILMDDVSARFHWAHWFGVYLRRSNLIEHFRYLKVDCFETMEINICRWLNKLFVACVCDRDVDWAPDEVLRVQLLFLRPRCLWVSVRRNDQEF